MERKEKRGPEACERCPKLEKLEQLQHKIKGQIIEECAEVKQKILAAKKATHLKISLKHYWKVFLFTGFISTPKRQSVSWNIEKKELDNERERNCVLNSQVTEFQLDRRCLEDQVNYARRVIRNTCREREKIQSENEKLRLKLRSTEEREDSLRQNVLSIKRDKDLFCEKNEGLQLKLSRKREEVDFYRNENRHLVEEIESFESDRKRIESELAEARREIDHIKSEEYQMSIALPYALEIENKQERINELERALATNSSETNAQPPLEKQHKTAKPPALVITSEKSVTPAKKSLCRTKSAEPSNHGHRKALASSMANILEKQESISEPSTPREDMDITEWPLTGLPASPQVSRHTKF